MTNQPPPLDAKLSPCPFCGAAPVRVDEQRAKIDHAADCYMRRYVGSGQLWMLADAELWNRRATQRESGGVPIPHFSTRQREYIAILTRPDIGWRVSSVELAREADRLTLTEPPLSASQRKECEVCGGTGQVPHQSTSRFDDTPANELVPWEMRCVCQYCAGTGQRKETP